MTTPVTMALPLSLTSKSSRDADSAVDQSDVSDVHVDQSDVHVELRHTRQEPFGPSDYTRTGPDQTTRNHYLVLSLLIVAVTFERAGFYALLTGLTELGALSSSGQTLALVMCLRAGGQFIFPQVGAWFGEVILGSYTAALIGTILELVGSCFLLSLITALRSPLANVTSNSTMSNDWINNNAHWNETVPASPVVLTPLYFGLMITGIVLVLLGLALTRSNYMMLAAMQIPEDRLEPTNFFLWYFFFIDIGTLVGFCFSGLPIFRDQVIIWPCLFFVPLLILIIVKFVSRDKLNHAKTIGCDAFLDCLKPRCWPGERRDSDANLRRLYKHMIKIMLVISVNLSFQYLYAMLTLWSPQERWYRYGQDEYVEYAWIINIYDPLSVAIATPIAHFCIIPVLRRYFPRVAKSLSLMGLGMFLIAVACFVTALQEGLNETDDVMLDMVYQLPQFLVLGLAEMFCYAKSYEFVYLETPKYLKNQMLGLYFSVMGLGLLLMWGTVQWCEYSGFIKSHEPLEHVVYLHCIIGAIQILFFLLFCGLIYVYKYRVNYQHSVSTAIDNKLHCTSRKPGATSGSSNSGRAFFGSIGSIFSSRGQSTDSTAGVRPTTDSIFVGGQSMVSTVGGKSTDNLMRP